MLEVCVATHAIKIIKVTILGREKEMEFWTRVLNLERRRSTSLINTLQGKCLRCICGYITPFNVSFNIIHGSKSIENILNLQEYQKEKKVRFFHQEVIPSLEVHIYDKLNYE